MSNLRPDVQAIDTLLEDDKYDRDDWLDEEYLNIFDDNWDECIQENAAIIYQFINRNINNDLIRELIRDLVDSFDEDNPKHMDGLFEDWKEVQDES